MDAVASEPKTVVVCGFSACDMRKCAIKNCCKLYGQANWQVTEEVIQPRLVSLGGHVRLYEGRFALEAVA
jgi:hypothetical protein